jgi:hypothetical protein
MGLKFVLAGDCWIFFWTYYKSYSKFVAKMNAWSLRRQKLIYKEGATRGALWFPIPIAPQ